MEALFIIVIIVIFLGLPIMQMRKQSKQVGQIRDFQSKLEPGMVVQMTSGIHGRISSVGPTTVDLELATGVVTTWDRNAVLKLVTSVEEGSTEAGHLTAGAEGAEDIDDASDFDESPVIPDDLSGLEGFEDTRGRDNSDDADSADETADADDADDADSADDTGDTDGTDDTDGEDRGTTGR